MRGDLIKTICLLFILAIPFAVLNAAAIESSDYMKPEVCGRCHSEIYAQWNGSMHSLAHKDPVYRKLFLIASKETNRTFDEFCTQCHAPIATLSGETPTFDNYEVSEVAEYGVSCDFCHTVSASSGIGNGAFVSSPGRTKYGPFNDSFSPFHDTAYSELHTKAEFCGMCHDVYHPFNGLALENTYTEWKEGPYNETTPCQHCHMTPGVTEFKQNPGKAARGAPMREHIYTHYFVGGNAMLGDLLGSPEHEKLAKERLRSAATIEITKIERINETVNLQVKVTNSGAGHKLPTGLTEARMIWLDVDVTDSSGKQVFRSGKRDEGGYIDHDAVIYHTVFGDADGNPTEKVWLADRILSDNRIPPKGYSIEDYTFTIPPDAVGPLSVSIKLNYISASQELSDFLFGKGEIIAPAIEMASTGVSIDIPDTKEMPGFSAVAVLSILIVFICVRIKQNKNQKR